MNYQLRVSKASKDAVATAELADHFAAEAWAKGWVQANAKQDSYRLDGDGGFCRLLFRTAAGQWYLTPANELTDA